MEVLKENMSEIDIGSSTASFKKFLDSQNNLFNSQVDQLGSIVLKQCELTGVNPLSQEIATGALSIKIGKRPRDLLNPKALKYMQAVFSIKDAISKKESREIGALFGIKVSQVREFFAGQCSRVRKLVRLSREKSVRSNTSNGLQDGVLAPSDPIITFVQAPINSIGRSSGEEVPSCSSQAEGLRGLDDSERYFVENIFSLMRKEETFSGQEGLMEWILRIQNPSVLNWFLSKGGMMILATWLSQAANEEQTSILLVVLKVLCHLRLHKALPVHMSAILHNVNRLQFYRTSDISNRARVLLARWSKMLARIQPIKSSDSSKPSCDAQREILMQQSIGEIMGDESWKSEFNIPGQALASLCENSETIRKSQPPQALKLLLSFADDTNRKSILDVSSSQTRERRKVQLVEQPGQKPAGRSLQPGRAIPVNQGRPMSADDIQKAKMRAQFMQYGKIGSSSKDKHEANSEGPSSKSSSSQTSSLLPASKAHAQPKIEENKKPVTLPPRINMVESPLPKPKLELKETLFEKCKKVQISWQAPPGISGSASQYVESNANKVDVMQRNVQHNMGNKQKDHLPRIPLQDMPRSRCSGKKFLTAIRGMSDEKLATIAAMGFGGLLQLATTELRHELCTWLMSVYDVAYHRISMATSTSMEVRLIDVEHAMGIPCNGLDVPLHPRRVVKGSLYNIHYLESQLNSLPVGDEFRKIFLIFTCATILAPNSKPEGMHDLWDFIWGSDVSIRRNWGKLLLHYLEDGITEFLSTKVRYVRGCLLFLQIFYLTKTYLPESDLVASPPWCAMWPDRVVKQRLATEIKLFGRYGLVEIKVIEVTSPTDEAPKRVQGTQEEDEGDAHSDDELNRLWKHAKEMVQMAEANLAAIEKLRRLKRAKKTTMPDNKASVPSIDPTTPLTNDASPS